MDTVDFIMAFECGELSDNQIIDGIAGAIKAGTVSAISGGNRMAQILIERRYISDAGEVLKYHTESV